MEKREKINFKIQAYLALIPYLGFLIVMLTSFYNIYKVKNRLWTAIYYLLVLPPALFFSGIGVLAVKFFILGKSPQTMAIAYSVLFFFLTLCIAFCCLGIEIALIKRLRRKENEKYPFLKRDARDCFSRKVLF